MSEQKRQPKKKADKIPVSLFSFNGEIFYLNDTDLWGLECALQHGVQDGYFKENPAWAERMLQLIGKIRNG